MRDSRGTILVAAAMATLALLAILRPAGEQLPQQIVSEVRTSGAAGDDAGFGTL